MPFREKVRIGLVATFGIILCGAALLKFGAPAPKWWGCWLGGSELAWGAFSAIELLLGLVLLAVVRHPASWLAAVGLLLVSTVATLMLSYGGAASCGCMGRVDTPPLAIAAFDGLFLLGLLATGPGVPLRRAAWATVSWGTILLGGGVLIGWSSMMLVALTHRQEDIIFPQRAVVPIVNSTSTQRIPVVIPVVNRSSQAIVILPPVEGPLRFPSGPVRMAPNSQVYIFGMMGPVSKDRKHFCYEWQMRIATRDGLVRRRGYITDFVPFFLYWRKLP